MRVLSHLIPNVVREQSSGSISRSNTNKLVSESVNSRRETEPKRIRKNTELEEVSCEQRPDTVEDLGSLKVFQALDFRSRGYLKR